MKNCITFIFILIFSLQKIVFAQGNVEEKIRKQIGSKTDSVLLKNLALNLKDKYEASKLEAIKLFRSKGYPIKKTNSDGSTFEFQGFLNGRPIYYSTHNRIAAQTVSTSSVWSQYGLDGSGINIGLWDGGSVDVDHMSFREGTYGQQHAYFIDSTGSETSDHATHVAGTLIADNDEYNAKGMANKSIVYSRDFNSDLIEMTNAAAGIDPSFPGHLILSNHSYGPLTGWTNEDLLNLGSNNAWYWMATANDVEDPSFGKYGEVAWNTDYLTYSAPFYSIVRSAGNDRGEGPDEPNAEHYVMSNGSWVTSTLFHFKDGGNDMYDCIPANAVGKNIITVGAIDDIPGQYQDTSEVKQIVTKFSVWGPTDDGRIKPDIVANGDNLYSTLPNNTFDYKSGTSMSAPNATGSLALLLQHYFNTHNSTYPLASTLKAMVIHTADEAGSTLGPDYKYGWGLLNTYKAANLISLDQSKPTAIQELILQNGQPITINNLYTDGTQPIKITLVWNDPPPSNWTTAPVLVNDLDLRMIGSTTYYPWKLNSAQPNLAATTGDNMKDNVEQIFVQAATAGYYTVSISHKGTLSANQNFSIIISGFIEPFTTFNLKQLGNDSQTFGQAAYWDNSVWNYVPPTQPVTLSIDRHHFLSTQDYRPSTFEKFQRWEDNLPSTLDWYRNWDTISIKSTTNLVSSRFLPTSSSYVKNNLEGVLTLTDNVTDYIQFKDPWLVDFTEQPYGIRSRGLEAQLVSVSSPLNLTTASNYKGVFLNQDPTFDLALPNYSVKSNQVQSINLGGSIGARNFYFQNWSRDYIGGQPSAEFQDSMALETGVVFKNANAVVNAHFKGTQLSSQDNAYNNTSQRKFIRLHNNEMMHVYSSMSKIWLETSTDNGVTWQLRNAGKPLTQQESKLPSVCQIGQSYIIIALQERKTDGGYNIKVIIYDLASDMIVAEGIAADPGNKLYTEDANPVVACPREGIQNFLLVWEEAHYGEFQPGGLYSRYGKLVSGPSVSWINYTDVITGTDLNTHVPALVTDFSDNEYPLYYRLAYEQHSTGNISAIHYRNISANATTVTVPSATNISANAGFSKNTKPSLIAASNGARISWIGYRVIEEEGEGMDKKTANGLGKVNADIETEQKVVFNDPTNLSVYWNFGANVQSTSINKSNDCYSIAWGRSNTLPVQFADSYTLSSIFTIGDLIGKDVQLSNGTTRTTMKAMAFNSNSQPYYFNNKQLYLSKVNLADIGSGREGVVSKDNAQFYFAVGDLRVNDQLVKFIEFEDSVSFYSNQRLNEFLLSEPFSLTNNSNFTYSVQYGITDSAAAVNTLDNNDFINFKVELIDDQTGELLGLFDDITYTRANAAQYENMAYQVNTEGIGNRTVRLRLVTTNNFDPKYSLTDRYAEGSALLKSSFKQVSFQGSLKVDSYDLSQNYPNPFNPTTTINYQIKEDGLVTLKIYDILGAEIKTLVNEEKTKGRYSYNFNGSDLATGVYIYQLKVNDFVSSKKLMLLK